MPETAPDPAALRETLVEAGERDPGAGLSAAPLAGGASRELWALTPAGAAGPAWVLRRDPAGETPQTSRAGEFAVQQAAFDAGVPVPRPVAVEEAGGRFGTAGMLMAWVDGEAIPRRVMREPALQDARATLPRGLGTALAALRAMDTSALGTHAPSPVDAAATALEAVRAQLDETGQALPTLELALRWLRLRLPPPTPPSVVHGDFRLGNFIVGPDGLRAIVDWEFWHLGDPAEDLAWVCARPWRFGVDAQPVAGIGPLDELLGGFGGDVDRDRLRWWGVLVQAKWGAYCARQAALRRAGEHASLERTVLARRVAEAEWDLLALMGEEDAR